MTRHLALILVLAACGQLQTRRSPSRHRSPVRSRRSTPPISRAYDSATAANHGWPSVTDCDATVWAGTAALGGAPVFITLAEWAPGRDSPQAAGGRRVLSRRRGVDRFPAMTLVLYMAAAFYQKNTPALPAPPGLRQHHQQRLDGRAARSQLHADDADRTRGPLAGDLRRPAPASTSRRRAPRTTKTTSRSRRSCSRRPSTAAPTAGSWRSSNRSPRNTRTTPSSRQPRASTRATA